MSATVPTKCDHSSVTWVGWRSANGLRPEPRRDCDRPVWLRCNDCGYLIVARCKSKNVNACEPCANTYRNQVRWRAGDGLVKRGQLVVVTFTAPGADVLPWDTSKCNHVASIECSGKIGCRVKAAAASEWNATAAERWNHLLQDLRRLYGDLEYFRAVEVQTRGVLHFHIPIRAASTSVWHESEVRRLALKHGFGSQVKLDVRPHLDKLGGYVAKYVSKSVSERQRAPMPEGRTWRVYSASRNWGMTMAQIRMAQFLFQVRQNSAASSVAVSLSQSESESGGEAAALIARLAVTQAPLASAVTEAM